LNSRGNFLYSLLCHDAVPLAKYFGGSDATISTAMLLCDSQQDWVLDVPVSD